MFAWDVAQFVGLFYFNRLPFVKKRKTLSFFEKLLPFGTAWKRDAVQGLRDAQGKTGRARA